MSGLYVIPKAPGGHQALPVGGSWRSERTGEPAVLTDASCYPVTAECQECHRPIRLDRLRQMEWTHAPGGTAATP